MLTLQEKVIKLEKELEETKEALKKALQRIEELESKLQEKDKPDFIKDPVKTKPKKTGQKNGHEGYTRHIPERIDEIKELKISRCPYCNTKLSKTQETRERYVTDIPEVRTINTKYIIHRKYCKKCKSIVEAEVKNALPNARFGLRLMLLIMFLKLGLRIPSKKVIELMKVQYALIISDGEIYKILEQLSTAFGSYHEELKRKMIKSAVKHIDETGWRVDGKNYWLWHFINKEIALYSVKKKRNSDVPIKLLGNQEGKIVVSDRFNAYSQLAKKSGCLQQVCWSHLLRNSKDLAEHYREARYIHKRVKYIYGKAKEGISKEKLLHWIDLLANREYKHSEVYKFVKSICRVHRDNLFRFADNLEVDSTNNRAERGLRHAVVMRKISNGNRSEKGAEVTGRLLSVIKSLELQEVNPFTGTMDLLQDSK